MRCSGCKTGLRGARRAGCDHRLTFVAAAWCGAAQRLNHAYRRIPFPASRNLAAAEHQGTIMTKHHASRGLRAALFVFSGALLLGLAACNNGYGPPLPGQTSLTWGQQHYLDVQKARARHDATRSNNSGTNGPGVPH
jgi:hypothetical protein